MAEIKLRVIDFKKVNKRYLNERSNDELLQVYVIAGVFWKVDNYVDWKRPTLLARKLILFRMKEWGVAND